MLYSEAGGVCMCLWVLVLVNKMDRWIECHGVCYSEASIVHPRPQLLVSGNAIWYPHPTCW